MSKSPPIGIFGIKSFTPYSRTTGLPFGMAEVLGTFSINSAQELIDLNGGSSPDAWASERGLRTNEMTLSLREYPAFLWELLMGTTVTTSTAEAAGGFSDLKNVKGTSAFDAAIGVATATAKAASETDLKTGIYVVKVISATTVDVYSMSDIDFANGTLKEFEDDTLKITELPLTITTAVAVEIPGYGIELTGGSGTIGMTIGDTFIFEIRAINTGRDEAEIGGNNQSFTNFGAIVYAQKRSTGEIFEFNFSELVVGGMPVNLNEQAWSEYELNMKPVRALNKITNTTILYKYRRVIDSVA